jgi:hypothetical protein
MRFDVFHSLRRTTLVDVFASQISHRIPITLMGFTHKICCFVIY